MSTTSLRVALLAVLCTAVSLVMATPSHAQHGHRQRHHAQQHHAQRHHAQQHHAQQHHVQRHQVQQHAQQHHVQRHHVQRHQVQQQRVTGAHIDHQDYVVRDHHGQVVRRIHRDIIHSDSTHVVPHTDTLHPGSYYSLNGGYYYHPQTLSTGTRRVTAYRAEPIAFGSFSHVNDLSSRLETLSNEFCLDLHHNYPHNPGFRETYREAYEIVRTARYIHDAEHQHDREAIRQKIGELDQLFHHVQEGVRGWRRQHHRQIGSLGIQTKVDRIESTLHHLMNDVGVRPGSVAGGGSTSTSSGTPTLAPPPSLP